MDRATEPSRTILFPLAGERRGKAASSVAALPRRPAGGVRVLRETARKLVLPGLASDQSIFGSVSDWWNGGGLLSVHSSVVAPSPHGLPGAFLPAISDQTTLTKKIAMPEAIII